MSRSPNIDWYRHLSFAAVGGFFAAYAILLRMGVMANAQTLNLLELLLNSLRGNWSSVLLHTGALVIYMLGTMSTVILPHLFGWNMRRVHSPLPLPYLFCHERAVELLLRCSEQHQLHHLLHQQYQTGFSLPGPPPVPTGTGPTAPDVVLSLHTSVLPFGGRSGLFRGLPSAGTGFSVCSAPGRLGLLYGGVRGPA